MIALASQLPLIALVLAGGKASRMGGGDKPLRLLAGRPILAHVLERIAPQCAVLALNANGDPARLAAFGLPILPDTIADYPGPLAGILAGLDWAAEFHPQCRDVLSVPGDCPFLPADLASRLEAGRAAAALPLACAASGGWTHPVIGLWPVSLRAGLRAALKAGERKIDRFTAAYGCAALEWPTTPFDPFFNVNTPEELEQAQALHAAHAAARLS